MKILVDKIPSNCFNCLFFGSIHKPSMYGDDKYFSGCTLLRVELPMEISFSTRLGNCPLETAS